MYILLGILLGITLGNLAAGYDLKTKGRILSGSSVQFQYVLILLTGITIGIVLQISSFYSIKEDTRIGDTFLGTMLVKHGLTENEYTYVENILEDIRIKQGKRNLDYYKECMDIRDLIKKGEQITYKTYLDFKGIKANYCEELIERIDNENEETLQGIWFTSGHKLVEIMEKKADLLGIDYKKTIYYKEWGKYLQKMQLNFIIEQIVFLSKWLFAILLFGIFIISFNFADTGEVYILPKKIRNILVKFLWIIFVTIILIITIKITENYQIDIFMLANSFRDS